MPTLLTLLEVSWKILKWKKKSIMINLTLSENIWPNIKLIKTWLIES
jgi:hypothetical protein